MTEQEAFIQAIVETPDDDVARLIYADWLEDHGEPERADFIRSQIERARLPIGDARAMAMEKREQALMRRFARRWFRPPRHWKVGLNVLIHRGFPASLHVDAKSLLDHAEVFARWPITRLLRTGMWGSPQLARRLAASPFLRHIRYLDLYYLHLGRELLLIVLTSPHLSGLVRLKAGSNRLGDEGVSELARLSHLTGLRDLDLANNEITDVGLAHLSHGKDFHAVRSLNLCGNRISINGVIALLHSDNWPALTELCLWSTSLGDDELQRLASCSALTKLTKLNLNNNRITNRGVEALASSPHAANLRTLELAVNRISAPGAHVLTRSPHLQGLNSLCLYKNPGIVWQTRRKLHAEFGERVSFEQPW
jgi:uncharacterized protein (TIGR02996 family)